MALGVVRGKKETPIIVVRFKVKIWKLFRGDAVRLLKREKRKKRNGSRREMQFRLFSINVRATGEGKGRRGAVKWFIGHRKKLSGETAGGEKVGDERGKGHLVVDYEEPAHLC